MRLAAVKGMTVPDFVWDLVMETIEDDEDVREAMLAVEEEGRMTLEECKRQSEIKDRP